MRAFMKWASSNLVGHIVVFELGAGVPLILAALYGWFQRSVSTGDLIRGTIIAVTCSGLGGVIFWFIFSRGPLQRRQAAARTPPDARKAGS